MSAPGIYKEGDLVMLTRRIVCGFWLLKPDKKVREAIIFVLGHYVRRDGIIVHGIDVQGNHFHLLFSDPLGKRVDFQRDFVRTVSNYLRARYKTNEASFDQVRSAVRCHGPTEVADKLADIVANPVVCGAVKFGFEWPGFRTGVDDIGRQMYCAKRPEEYFSKNGVFPESEEVCFELPSCLTADTSWMPEGRTGEEGVRAFLSELVQAKEDEARAKMRKSERSFMGRKRSLAASHTKRTPKPRRPHGLNPMIGGGLELSERAVNELKRFREAYAIALDRWRKGDREVVFPHGTYHMRVHHNARCAPS